MADVDAWYGSLPASGGTLVHTADGGRTWAPRAAPAHVQSVCFVGAGEGWLTAAGTLHRTTDSGRSWEPVALPGRRATVAQVQCAPGVAWVVSQSGAALGTTGHALYRVPASGDPVAVVAAPQVHLVDAPPTEGSYPGGLSSISPSAAVLVGYTPAFAAGRATRLAVATDEGASVLRPGTPVPEVGRPTGVGFASEQRGWLAGIPPTPSGGPTHAVIARTDDGGASWAIQYRTA